MHFIMEDLWNGVKVIVTGGAGFIGSHLVERLVSLNAKVSVLIRNGSDTWRLNDVKDKVSVYEVDFLNSTDLKKTVDRINPEIVFHAMADIRVKRDPELLNHMIGNNFQTTINLIRVLDKEKIKLFVNFGTCEEYGDGKVPFEETYKEIPVSPYSLSKTLGTYLSSYLAKIEGFPIITVRPFLTYGPKQINNQLIPFIIRSLIKKEKINLGKMEQTRDFIHVNDVVSALIKIPFSNIEKGEIINICSGKEAQIKSVVSKVCELTNTSFEEYIETTAPYRPGETMHFYGSNQKAKKLLNWEPKIDFEKGLKETVEWYREYLEKIK